MARLFQRAKWIAARNSRVASVVILFIAFLLLAAIPRWSNPAAGKSGKNPISSTALSSVSSISPNVSTTTPNYTITTTTGAEIVPGDTDIGNHIDDGTTQINLPFPVILYDQVFTTVNASSNGTLQFSDNDPSYVNNCLPASGFNGAFLYTIFPFWDDQYTGDTANGQGIFTSVSGTAPNRIFNIEWRTTYCCDSGSPTLGYEVRLYEGQRKFDVIYGSTFSDRGSATVGVQKDQINFTQYECNTSSNPDGSLFSGLQLTFEIAPPCAPAPASMIAWWKAEGDAKDSQGNHDGTINDATFAAGEVGQAFSFDGTDDSVSIPDSSDWNFGTGDFTFDFWARAEAGAARMYALDFAPVPLQQNLDFDFNDGVGLVVFWNGNGTNNGSDSIQLGTPGQYTDGQWHHYALTRSGSTWTLYIDGTVAGTASNSEALDLSGGSNHQLGALFLSGSEHNFWNGQIDEVEIFNRALTSTEVASLYIAGSQGKCPCTSAPEGMVSWWQGEGDAVDSKDGNDGTFNGTPAYGPGEVRQAFSFDGSSWVSVPAPSSLDLTQFTLDAWIYPTTTSGIRYIIDKESPGNNDSNYYLALEDGNTIEFGFNPGQYQSIDSTVAVPVNAWSHVTATYDGTTLKLYINGVLSVMADAASGFQTPPTGQPFAIGIRNIDFSDGFVGLIDEVEVFSRALTDAEVLSIYAAGGAGKCRSCTPAPGGMISWWKAETNANDSEDNNNGTFNGTPAYNAGKVGQAFSLDGSSWVQVPDATNLHFTTQFTLDAWVYSDLSGVPIIFSKFGESNFSYELHLQSDGSVRSNISGDGTSYDSLISNAGVVSTNTWAHVTTTFNAGDWRIYVNGVQVASKTSSVTSIFPGTSDLLIGTNTSLYFTCLIVEAETFDRALSQSEIRKIYDAGSAGKCPCVTPPNNMIAWWPGDDNAKDIKGGHDGTLNDATFGPGEVSDAFKFDGTDDSVSIPASNDWNFGTGEFTFDFWAISNDSTDRMHALSFEPDPTFATNNLDFNF